LVIDRHLAGTNSAVPSRSLADLLDATRAFVTRYIVVGAPEAVVIALWIAHAWVLGAFDVTGYLHVRSPVRRCGKSTLLDLMELLVPRAWKTIEPSEAVLFRRIGQSMPTLLLDEVDAIFNRRAEATEGLRACLNAGNKRGTTVPRCVPPRMEIAEFSVFCPKVLASIGGLPATVTDRSIPIEMRRKWPGDQVERFRLRKARQVAVPLRAVWERWGDGAVAQVELELTQIEHLADEGGPLASLDDRAWEQAWEPLIAVASLAGEAWLEKAIAAAITLSGNRDDELDTNVTLLADIETIFHARTDRESLSTKELLEALLQIEESPWRGSWSDARSDDLKPSKAAPRRLAATLKPFGIRPVDVWTPSGVTRKGYRLDDFRDAWARYLSPDAQDPRGPREPAVHAASGLADELHESARDAADTRDPRGEPTVSSGSRPPRGYRPPGENDGQPDECLPETASGARSMAWRRRNAPGPATEGQAPMQHSPYSPSPRPPVSCGKP
jgi:Protein of unknown function (DUF3631)